MSVGNEIASLFDDPDGSKAVIKAAQHIAAPMVQGTPFEHEELIGGGGIRVVIFVFDSSPSMVKVAEDLRQGFNEDYVDAVREARESDVSALRIGGVAFSSGPAWPVWVKTKRNAQGQTEQVYFHSLDELPKLTTAEYDPNRGYGTALHQAILDATARGIRYAAEQQSLTNINVDLDVIVISDGANTDPPMEPRPVKQMVKASKKTRVRFVALYVETQLGLSVKPGPGGGLSEVQKYFIEDLGFNGEQVQSFALDPEELQMDEEAAKKARKRRIRRLMAVMSRISATRGKSAVAAAKNVLDDDELV